MGLQNAVICKTKPNYQTTQRQVTNDYNQERRKIQWNSFLGDTYISYKNVNETILNSNTRDGLYYHILHKYKL